MKTRRTTRVAAVGVAAVVLASCMFFLPEASAQSGRRITGSRGPGISRSPVSRNPGRPSMPGRGLSGGQGLANLGSLLDAAGRYWGQEGYPGWDRHDSYYDSNKEYADAYRDVGIANAVVDLVGILVSGAYASGAYAAPVPQPTAVVPVQPAPVAVAPPPQIIVVPQTPVYYYPAPYCAPQTYYGAPSYRGLPPIAPYPPLSYRSYGYGSGAPRPYSGEFQRIGRSGGRTYGTPSVRSSQRYRSSGSVPVSSLERGRSGSFRQSGSQPMSRSYRIR